MTLPTPERRFQKEISMAPIFPNGPSHYIMSKIAFFSFYQAPVSIQGAFVQPVLWTQPIRPGVLSTKTSATPKPAPLGGRPGMLRGVFSHMMSLYSISYGTHATPIQSHRQQRQTVSSHNQFLYSSGCSKRHYNRHNAARRIDNQVSPIHCLVIKKMTVRSALCTVMSPQM